MLGGTRDYSVDILRCISCFFVVTSHVTAYMLPENGFTSIEYDSTASYTLLVIRSVSICATNIFLMISGIFLLSPERNVTAKTVWSKNILKMTSAYILWCAMYALFRIYYETPMEFTPKVFINQWLIQENHMWYIPMMIGVYVLVPVMRVFTANAQRKHYHYLFAIFAGGIVLNSLRICCRSYKFPYWESVIDVIEKTPVNLICVYPVFCIFGYYLYTYRLPKKVRLAIYAAGIIGILISFLSCLLMMETSGQMEGSLIHSKFAIGNFLKTIAIFVLVTTVLADIKLSAKVKKLISKLSASTLFIYLFHWMLMMVLYHEGFLLSSGINVVAVDIIYIVLIYVTGFILSFVFLQCIPWVKMRNIVLDKFWPNRTIYVTRKKK